jgi:hypothetical protein
MCKRIYIVIVEVKKGREELKKLHLPKNYDSKIGRNYER